jgi:hypothetical protein
MPIYRKGEGQMEDSGVHTGLRNRALEQSIGEMDITRKMTSSEKFEREQANGVGGAKNAVNLGTTISEATENPDSLGGPVSGAALAKLKAKKSEAKRTEAKEKKRR